MGMLFFPVVVLSPLQMSMPTPTLFAIIGAISVVISSAKFAMIAPVLASVTPYRLRSQGTAIVIAMVFGVGGVGGAVIGGLISNELGPRWAVILLAGPANLIGGLLLVNGARFIRNDLSLIAEEIEEEQAEHAARIADPDNVPALQVSNVDFSYGRVQVLFDVNFDVAKGETLALLGTNGAGKSTALRTISGLAIPSRGVVRLNGQTITLTSPETRVKLGIHQLPGGKALFEPMTVRDNLEMAAFIYRDRADADRRIEGALDLFPQLGPPARGRRSLGWPAADAWPRDGARPRTRGAHHRRTLTWARSDRRPAAARDHRSAQGRRPDDDHRRAIAPGRARRRRPGDFHGEGPGQVQWPHRRAARGDDLARAVFLGADS